MTNPAAARQHYQALVDIGSNGIRFSISDLSPPTSRITPTIFQDRAGISLYDAQHSTGTKLPISAAVIDTAVESLLRFKRTCADFMVPDGNITIVATEATRNAINREALLSQIKEATGWEVQLLAKEEEGRLGTMGIVSSVDSLDGICIDMGGGSIQLTWASQAGDGDFRTGPSISLPYGAAALMSRLSTASSAEQGQLHPEILSKLQAAFDQDLQIPNDARERAERNGGFNLYLSGGGLRGWGHILMSMENVQPYPIPIINGYSVTETHFYSGLDYNLDQALIHRISKRRASQVPAVKTLLTALKQTQLSISNVTFAQGGVREGLIFSGLSPDIRAQNPLISSTLPFAPRSGTRLLRLLRDAVPYPIEQALLEATINLLYVHGSISKDIRSAAALRCTTTGILAGAHGLSHHDRQILALILCERWGGDVSEADQNFLTSVRSLCGAEGWWARYVGRAAEGIAELYPAGLVRDDEQSVTIESGFANNEGNTGQDSCWIRINVLRLDAAHVVKAWAKDLEKLGKKKNWLNGEKGLGVRVDVISSTER